MSELDQYIKDFQDGASEIEKVCFDYLVNHVGYDEEDAVVKIDEVIIWEGALEDYAEQLMDDCYDMDNLLNVELGNLKNYVEFNYKAFARDLDICGDVYHMGDNLWVTNPYEF